MKKPKISVIIPVYNVEKYISRCLDSVTNQSYANLEIIIVDDGSKDKSYDICKEYKIKDDRIVLIHQENRGVSTARNRGLQKCSGELISFIDSDDFVRIDYFEKLQDLMETYHCDAAQCRYEMGRRDVFSRQKIIKTKLLQHDELLKLKNFHVAVWAKLFRRECVIDLRFPEGMLYEDTFYTYKALYYAQSVVSTTEKMYYYYLSPKSITRGEKKEINIDFVIGNKERLKFFIEKGDQNEIFNAYEAILGSFIAAYRIYRKREYYEGKKYDNERKKMYNKFLEFYDYINWPSVNYKDKFKYISFRYFPKLACDSYAMLKKIKGQC